MSEKKVDVAIIGAGPAGIAAGIYLTRVGYSIALFEMNKVGGLLRNANLVENYPGLPTGISGLRLVKRFVTQMKRHRVRVTITKVERISVVEGGFLVETDVGMYKSLTVIIATGTHPKKIKLPGMNSLIDRVFYEIADIPSAMIRGQKFAVIGGGDAAFDYALSIHRMGGIPIIVSRSAPCCIRLLEKRANSAGIKCIVGAKLLGLRSADDRALLRYRQGTMTDELCVEYVLMACGRTPNIPRIEIKLKGFLRLRNRGVATDILGLFLAGDLLRERYRQASIAVGDGIHAAMLADEYLRKVYR